MFDYEKSVLGIGAGYVGGPTFAVLALKNPDYMFTCADINPERIEQWNSDYLPIYEPGLEEIVKYVRDEQKNLVFKTIEPSLIKQNHIIYVSVNTPTKTFGKGANVAADLHYWESTARYIAQHSDRNKVIVDKSTLPVGQADVMKDILDANTKGLLFHIISNPETMAEGSAIEDLLNPDRVIIGGDHQPSMEKIGELYHFCNKIVYPNLWSAELSKLASNLKLAQKTTTTNSFIPFCEKTDALIEEVEYITAHDSRIGGWGFDKQGNPRPMRPRKVGFGGSCFEKDILNLCYMAKQKNLDEVSDYWTGIIEMNRYIKKYMVSQVMEQLYNTLVNKKITILGTAFKPNTGDTRMSPAIDLVDMLYDEKAIINTFDPQANDNFRKDMETLLKKKQLENKNNGSQQIFFYEDPYEAAKDSHAIIIACEWNEFKDYDYQRIFDSMQKPAWLFDGIASNLPQQELYDIGFNVQPTGAPLLKHS